MSMDFALLEPSSTTHPRHDQENACRGRLEPALHPHQSVPSGQQALLKALPRTSDEALTARGAGTRASRLTKPSQPKPVAPLAVLTMGRVDLGTFADNHSIDWCIYPSAEIHVYSTVTLPNLVLR